MIAALRRRAALVRGWPLATRLTLAMLCVAALAISVLFYELSRANRAEVERLQITALRNGAQDLARNLDGLIAGELRRVSNLALSRPAQEFVSVRPDERAPLFTPTLADFSNFLDSNRPFYRAVLLLDREGEVLTATDGSYVGQRFPGSAFFQAARRGDVYMSDPGISPLDRQPVIWLAAPVFTGGGGASAAPAGVVAVALAPEELWHAVEQVRIGNGGYAVLLDQHGIRLAHGADRRYVFRSLAPLPPATWAALQAEGRFAGLPRIADTGSYALLDYVGGGAEAPLVAEPAPGAPRVYHSMARLESRPWVVVAMLAEGEVLAPADAVTLRGVAATVVVVVLLGLTVAWVARRLLRPVPRLADAAERIAGGDLAAPIRPSGSGELRSLAESFETMRRRLQQARDELSTWAQTLERRVVLRSREVAALSEVVALASRGQSRGELLQTALDRALPVMSAEMGGIWLAEPDGTLRLTAKAGFERELDEELTTFASGEGLLGQVQAQGQPIALDDISQSPRLSRAIVRAEGLHAFAAVPLRVAGRTLGVLGVFSRSRQGFSAEAVGLATSIGQQIALSLDNRALVGQLQQRARDVAALQERERIAGEIHDGIAQNLSYLYLQLDRLAADAPGTAPGELQDRLAALQDVLGATTDEVRQFIAHLQEVPPPPEPLGDRLRADVRRLAGELSLGVEVAVATDGDLLVPADVGAELSRIVGEALRNADRHGRATSAQVELRRESGLGLLRISDDGVGFDPAAAAAAGHFGLNVMRARAERIGGTLSITSGARAGTCVEARWPIEGHDGTA